MRSGSLTRAPALSSRPVRGKSVSLRQLLLDVGDDALARGDAGLDRVLDAAGHGGDLLGHDVVATVGLTRDSVRLTLDAALAATDQALGTRARLAGLRRATALEAAQGDPAAARERLGDVGGDAGDAVTRLQDSADVDQPGALGDVATLLRRRLGSGGLSLGGLAGLVLRGGTRATTGGLRRRLGGRRAGGRTAWWCARCACESRQPSWRRRCASQQTCCCGGGAVVVAMWVSAPLLVARNDISSKSVRKKCTQRTHVCKPLPGLCYLVVTKAPLRAKKRSRLRDNANTCSCLGDPP